MNKMDKEIVQVLDKRRQVKPSKLTFGDIVFIKRFNQGNFEPATTGPHIFIRYNSQARTTVTTFDTITKRVRVSHVGHISPARGL